MFKVARLLTQSYDASVMGEQLFLLYATLSAPASHTHTQARAVIHT